jgi:ethanolamine utilization cobalamin adenosyltransferase
MDFGTWRGSTAVLCENYRAIYETLNFQRYIYAFDTFIGYQGFKENEARTKEMSNGKYSVENSYEETLDYILKLHEKSNAMGHINGKHTVLKGDVRETLPKLLDTNKGLSIALVFLDISSYEPTKIVLENVIDRLVKGGIIAMWQFGRKEIEAEGRVFFELLNNKIKYSIHTCKTYPSLVYIVKEA